MALDRPPQQEPVGIALRDYQRDSIAAINAAEDEGLRQLLTVLPTGAGKTIVFASVLQERIARGPALVLAHRDELIRQAADKIQMVDHRMPVGIWKAERNQWRAPIVVGSVQTLSRESRLKAVPPGHFRTIIIDEAHHATGPSYKRILKYLGAFDRDDVLTLGYTATPVSGLGSVFQKEVYRKEILDLILDGYLCDLRAKTVHLEADFSKLHTRNGDFVEEELEQLFREAGAPAVTVRAYREHAEGRKALVFTPSVATAYEMADEFTRQGIPADAIDGETPLARRQLLLKQFKSGAIRVLANCAVLTEGFDEPSIDCVIIARPTKSKVLYAQCLGRGTRLHPGKEDCLVLDLAGATLRHDLMSMAKLLDLDPKLTGKGETVPSVAKVARKQIEEKEREARRAGLLGLADELQRQLVAQNVDVFRRRATWVTTGQRFVLAVKEGYIVLQPKGADTYDVVKQARGKEDAVLATDLSLGYAQGVAEDWARREAPALSDPNAKWRHSAPSEKQIAAAQRMRIPEPENMTRGELSDAMTAAIARRQEKESHRKVFAAPQPCGACQRKFTQLFRGLCFGCYDQ